MRDFSRNIIPKSLEHYTFKLHTPRDFNRKTQPGHLSTRLARKSAFNIHLRSNLTQCFERFGAEQSITMHNNP